MTTRMKPWPKKTPWKVIVTGYKQRRCGRWFLLDTDGRWNLVFDDGYDPCNLGAKRDLVRDIRKTKHAKKILPKEYWRYLR